MKCLKALMLVVVSIVCFMDEAEAKDADICHNRQLVFLFDTSNSAEEYNIDREGKISDLAWFCQNLDSIIACVEKNGFNIEYDVFSINHNVECITKSVYESFTGHDISGSVDCEDWGKGSIALAEQYNWLQDYHHGVVVITDEPCECGLPDNGQDHMREEELVRVFRKNNMGIFLIRTPPWQSWIVSTNTSLYHNWNLVGYLVDRYPDLDTLRNGLCRSMTKFLSTRFGANGVKGSFCVPGDCIKMYAGAIGFYIPPCSYHWYPEQYFDDPYSDTVTICLQEPTTIYVDITDSLGCTFTDSRLYEFGDISFEYNDVRVCKPGDKVKMTYKTPLPQPKPKQKVK